MQQSNPRALGCMDCILPKILFYITFECWLFCPTVPFEGLSDVVFHIRSEGTGAVVVFVVALAGVDVDEMVLYGPLNTPRHVIIYGGEACRHADGLVIAEQRTIGTLRLGIVEVDAVDVNPVIRCVTAENAVQTMLTDRARCTVAYIIAVGFLSEDLFSCLWGNTLLLHVLCCYLSAKVINL